MKPFTVNLEFLFGFSDTWQLVINTGTTIVTFLMVFLIQNTQNRDTEALQIKLDELIKTTEGAANALLDLEELDEPELDRIRAKYEELAQKARDLQHGNRKPGLRAYRGLVAYVRRFPSLIVRWVKMEERKQPTDLSGEELRRILPVI